MAQKVAIFDLDDVLVINIQWYWARWDMFKYVMSSLGFEETDVGFIEKLNEHDMANLTNKGFYSECFGDSMGETYLHFCKESGREPDMTHYEAIKHIGHSVFDHRPIPYSGARKTLELLKSMGTPVYCVTKGDEKNQLRKLRESKLEGFFDEIHVVQADKRTALAEIMEKHPGLAPNDFFFVGNSFRGDILPALDLDITPVWIPVETWDFEDHGIDDLDAELRNKIVVLDNIGEVSSLFKT